MRTYVAETLNQNATLVNSKQGRPLLHYSIYPKCFPELVSDLIVRNANINAVFVEEQCTISAIQSLDFASVYAGYKSKKSYDVRGQPFIEAIKLLVAAGADPDSKFYYGKDTPWQWRPLSHEIASMKIYSQIKLETFELLAKAGATINAVDSEGWTLLESMFSSVSAKKMIFRVSHAFHPEANDTSGRRKQKERDRLSLAIWLLRNGSKITERMNLHRGDFSDFPWQDEEYVRKEYFAPMSYATNIMGFIKNVVPR